MENRTEMENDNTHQMKNAHISRILAIFTCHNRKALTERCLRTLAQNERVQFDYVVVDDGSTDGTGEMLKALPYRVDLV